MKAVLIFDNVNDLAFSKWDNSFIQHMTMVLGQQTNADLQETYTVSQLLSPLITSQRVMAAQFGNTYSSIQCKDGTNMVFDEWLDHVFVIISKEELDDIHRELLDCKTFVQHICGQNTTLLRSPVYQEWLSVLLECRMKGDKVPGANGVIGESGATAAALGALKAAITNIKCSPYQHYHLLLFVGDKLLALYSSRGSEDLTPADILLLGIQCVSAQEYWNDTDITRNETTLDKRTQQDNRDPHLPWLSKDNSATVNLCAGPTSSPCAPHSVHIAELAPRITFAMVIDLGLREIGISAHSASQILANLRRLLLQRNLELLPAALDSLELSVKKTTDALKKNKANVTLCARLSSRVVELRKSCTTTTPLTPETTAIAMHTALEAVIEHLRPDIPCISIREALQELQEKLLPYVDFLKVKALRYFSLGSNGNVDVDATCSLTRHKYVEDFPGLVHFIYIDRGAGRFLAPDMADCSDMLSRDTVCAMMSRGMRLLHEGYSAATWRSGALHVCIVLWWERGGTPIKPRSLHPAAVRSLPPPGDILGGFYRQLAEIVFGSDANMVCVKELLCVHLGLLPVATAVQQARRLAHTVHDVAGACDSCARPADLL